MKNKREVLAATGAAVFLVMAGVAIRYSGMLRDVPMLAIMAGYGLGAVSAWFAAKDWNKKTGKPAEGQDGT